MTGVRAMLSRAAWPLALGLGAAFLVTGFFDRPEEVHLQAGGEALNARPLTVDGEPPERIILEKNILKLGSSLSALPLSGVEAFTGRDPANWKIMAVVSGANPMAMLEINGRSATLRPGQEIYNWILEEITPTDVVWRSGLTERRVPLFQQGTGEAPVLELRQEVERTRP
ncbi:MAG: hypothetical protein PHV85_06165 [Desulfovibrionaceae bacterium]|nr:hypothetical protein [Desulfovibrionaceae bacterium]MDD4952115.1 hypothetical protein [Desulfovibrionaceae bacterium]